MLMVSMIIRRKEKIILNRDVYIKQIVSLFFTVR